MICLEKAAARLEGAIGSEHLEEAQLYLLAYRAFFDEVWNGLSPEERKGSNLPAEALELTRWAHSVTVSIRSGMEAQLRAMTIARPYRTGSDIDRKTWNVTG